MSKFIKWLFSEMAYTHFPSHSGYKKAKGTTGYLVRDLDGNCRFRVYATSGNYTDYLIQYIQRGDLRITIADKDAYLYNTEFGDVHIDCSKETLGIK